jgi:hypothetical protein
MDILEETNWPADTKLGEIAEELGEPVERIMDAFDAIKERRGEISYISLPED